MDLTNHSLPTYLEQQAYLYRLSKIRLSSSVDIQLHASQQNIFDDKTRFRVAACGRRFGKTTGAMKEALQAALSDKAVWWVLPTYDMATDVWYEIRRVATDVATNINQSQRLIRFGERGFLRILSGHEPDRLRGSGLDSVIIDEAAFCKEAVWDVLRPALSDRQGRATFLSTPNGLNWFWRLYARGLDPAFPDWKSWQLPTSSNPHIPASEIESARRDMPEVKFREEYLAEFNQDYGAVFRGVREVATLPLPEKDKLPELGFGQEFVMGVDWARYNDFTVITVMNIHNREMVYMDRFNQVDWELQRGRLKRLARHFKPRVIMAESNSIGEPNIEILQKEGLPVRAFQTTPSSKPGLIDALALAIENKEITLLNDDVLVNELQSYEMERLPSGTFRYGAPEGGHDDTVIAVALMWHAYNHNQPLTVETSRYA